MASLHQTLWHLAELNIKVKLISADNGNYIIHLGELGELVYFFPHVIEESVLVDKILELVDVYQLAKPSNPHKGYH